MLNTKEAGEQLAMNDGYFFQLLDRMAQGAERRGTGGLVMACDSALSWHRAFGLHGATFVACVCVSHLLSNSYV